MRVERAPDFGRSAYPSGGRLIGPAWQEIWDSLSYDGWVFVDDAIASAIRELPIASATARNLLCTAKRAGLVEVELRPVGTPVRRRAYYRKVRRS